MPHAEITPLRWTAVLSLSLAGLLATTAAQAIEVGAKAPSFAVVDSKGETQTLDTYAGKTVVLEWTNDGCPFVRKHYDSGNMQGLQKAAADDGVVWLTVISSAPGEQGFADGARADALTTSRDAAPTAVLLDSDGSMGRSYGALTTPHMYVINAEGVLAYIGGIDSIASSDPADIAKADNYVEAALEDLAANRPVEKPVSRPYRCSVKYAKS